MKILGIDPGLLRCGWGIVNYDQGRLRHIAHGVITPPAKDTLALRLLHIDQGLTQVLKSWQPDMAAIEETFVNKSGSSSLKLGQARGAAIVALARGGMEVTEYSANTIKKSLTGAGHAQKDQIQAMIRVLLPACQIDEADAADALAVAITHAHHSS